MKLSNITVSFSYKSAYVATVRKYNYSPTDIDYNPKTNLVTVTQKNGSVDILNLNNAQYWSYIPL